MEAHIGDGAVMMEVDDRTVRRAIHVDRESREISYGETADPELLMELSTQCLMP